MQLLETHPGLSVTDVQDRTGFELIIPDDVTTTESPPPEALEAMREIDPTGMVIGR
jgi:hypothetical protein